jgi:predicted MPP superfamily phosphohydrolase
MKKQTKNIILALSLALAAFFIWGLIEPFLLDIKAMEVKSQKLPQAFSGKKILFVTDIHCGAFFPINRTKQFISSLNALKPDLILIGGDYIQWNDTKIDECIKAFAELKAPLGVVGVLGNHDMRVDKFKGIAMEKMLENAGISILNDQTKTISLEGENIMVVGVDYFTNQEQWQKIQPKLKKNSFNILLAHDPDFILDAKPKHASLSLAGHTHGGQVTFFGLFAPLTHSKFGQDNFTGIKTFDNSPFVISNGVGTTFLPIRFFARPDIYMITLKKAP